MSIQWSKNSLFNKWYWENWTGTGQKMELNHQLIPYTRINSKWIKTLNLSHNTIKILAEHISSKISDISQSYMFANASPKAREIKEKINKWDYIKLTTFCTAKETIIKMKREQIV